jgi:hypothetical protein
MRLACVLAVVFAVSVAHADHKRAMQFYKAGEYEAARIELQAGYDLSKNPVFLWNLAKVAAKQGDRQAALDYVQRYRITLEAPDSEVDALVKNLMGPAEAPKPTETPKPIVKARSPIPWVLLGLGAGLLIADIGVGAAGYRLSQSTEGAAFTVTEWDELTAQGNRLNTAGWCLLGLGVGAAAAGGIWLAVRR